MLTPPEESRLGPVTVPLVSIVAVFVACLYLMSWLVRHDDHVAFDQGGLTETSAAATKD